MHVFLLYRNMMDTGDKRSSKAWQYFTDLKNFKAKCNICAKVMSYKGGGPYNLTRHTKSQHPSVFFASHQYKIKETEDDVSQPSTSYSSQPSTSCPSLPASSQTENSLTKPNIAFDTACLNFETIIEKPVKTTNTKLTNFFKPLSAKKSEQLNRNLVELIAKNYLPLNIVESNTFRNFIHGLNPNYTIPCRKTLSNALLVNYYNIEKQKVQKCLEGTDFISLTTDGWTSKPNEHYISLTAHFLNDKTELESKVLECYQYSDRQFAENLKNEIMRMCEDWNITNKIVAVTTDNANNIKAAVKLLKWKQIPCFAHTLNIIVQLALKEIKPTQMKIKSLVEHFRRSPLASERLKTMQKQLQEKELKLKQDVVTRWNSTLDMFTRVLETKKSLMSVITLEYPEIANLNNDDIEIMSYSKQILYFFKDVTEEMSSEKNVTISSVILISNALNKECRRFLSQEMPQPVKKMTEVLLNELTTRFLNIEDNNIFAESTLLDPRFKRHGFYNEFSYGRACTNLKHLVANVILRSQAEILIENPVETVVVEPLTKKKRNIWSDFDREVDEIIKNTNPTAGGIIEVDKYLEEPLLPRNKDPFIWWQQKKTAYPRLYEIVKKRLCICATSVPSERVFSKSGQIISERRNRLSGKKASMLLFLNYNM
ncbi:E3 SUMO-protein ligase ZBED1-like [Pieris napi]|uniref:E3 SUMO-protein ligase ZBED1-like n=1 Tax=Pieris napi TaxID=78633 RepID=UPI001FBAC49D|nr:E3 SUMO-protein ligase ZBED1-like [Pieris napi]